MKINHKYLFKPSYSIKPKNSCLMLTPIAPIADEVPLYFSQLSKTSIMSV